MSIPRSDVELIDETILSLFKSLWFYRRDTEELEPSADLLRHRLGLLTGSRQVRTAINVCRHFRNARAHYEYHLIDFEELGCAVSSLHHWLISSPNYKTDTKDSIMTRMAVNLCIHNTKSAPPTPSTDSTPSILSARQMERLSELTRDDCPTLKSLRETCIGGLIGAKLQLVDGGFGGMVGELIEWNSTNVSIRLDGDKHNTLISPKRRVKILSHPDSDDSDEDKPPVVFATDLPLECYLKELKIPAYRNRMKGARLTLLDGVHADKTVTFCGWNGTTVYIRFEEEHRNIRMTIDKRVRVIRWGDNGIDDESYPPSTDVPQSSNVQEQEAVIPSTEEQDRSIPEGSVVVQDQ